MKNVFINAHTPKGREVIRKYFTEDELSEKKDNLSKNFIDLDRKEDELDEIKEKFKQEMKPMKQRHMLLIKDIKQGFEDNEVEVYYVPDYDKGMMELYSTDGEKLHERKLTVSEKQQEMAFTQ